MKFKNFIFQAWKIMEFNCWSCKIIEIWVMCDKLDTANVKARIIKDKDSN